MGSIVSCHRAVNAMEGNLWAVSQLAWVVVEKDS